MNTQKKTLVYVAGYEGRNHMCSSGWIWTRAKQDALDHFNELKEDLEPQGAAIYFGELEVNDLHDEQIAREVEDYLEANDWENAFIKR